MRRFPPPWTVEALDGGIKGDRGRHRGSTSDLGTLDLFETYRPLIERVASATYDSNGPRDAEGLVLVTSEVLTRPVKA